MKQPYKEGATKGEKRIHYLVYVVLLIIAAAMALLGYWAFSKRDVLEVKNQPVPYRTIREHPTADGVIILKADYCKYASVTGRGRISFYSESREIFLPVFTDREGAKCEEREIPVLIPHEIAPGKYRIKFRIEYQVNPLRKHIEEFESQEFELVEAEGDKKDVKTVPHTD